MAQINAYEPKTAFGVLLKKGTEIYDHFFPDPEEQDRKEAAEIELKIRAAKEVLDQCLEKNKHGKKSRNGLPCACKDESMRFAAAAGFDGLEKVADDFKKNND